MSQLRALSLSGLALFLAIGASSATAAVDLNLLPDDSEIVVIANIRQILDSALVKEDKDTATKIKSLIDNALGDYGEARKYLKASGFDPFRDLVSVTFGHPGGGKWDEGFALIEGDFDTEKFHAVAAEAARDHADVVKITPVAEHKIIEVSRPTGKPALIVLANKNLILLCSNKERMQGALGRIAQAKGTLKPEVKALLETVNAEQSVRAVATSAALVRAMEKAPARNSQNPDEVLKSIDGLSGALTLAGDIQFQLAVAAKDANTAKMLAQQATVLVFFGKGLAAQKAKEDPRLLPIVDIMNTVRVTAQGKALLFRGEVAASNVDKLRKNFAN